MRMDYKHIFKLGNMFKASFNKKFFLIFLNVIILTMKLAFMVDLSCHVLFQLSTAAGSLCSPSQTPSSIFCPLCLSPSICLRVYRLNQPQLPCRRFLTHPLLFNLPFGSSMCQRSIVLSPRSNFPPSSLWLKSQCLAPQTCSVHWGWEWEGSWEKSLYCLTELIVFKMHLKLNDFSVSYFFTLN